MERLIPVEIFRKKSNTFWGISVFTETTKIFCTICLDYQCQASCREKAKNLRVFCKWYNSIPFLFSVPPPKKQYHLMEIFHRNFRTNGRRSRKELNSHWNGLGHQHGRRFIVLRHQFDGRDRFFFTLISIGYFNHLSNKTDQHQISPCNINAL